MRRQVATVSSATSSAPLQVSFSTRDFGIGFGCVVSAGGVLTYKVQHTFDDVFNAAVTPTWFDNATVTAQTTSKDGNYAFPVAAVRLTVTAYTSGSVTLTLLQQG
jgi:hypothetical protein